MGPKYAGFDGVVPRSQSSANGRSLEKHFSRLCTASHCVEMHLSHMGEEIREMAGLLTAAATPYTQLSCSENNLATASSRETVGPREVSRASDALPSISCRRLHGWECLVEAWCLIPPTQFGKPGGNTVQAGRRQVRFSLFQRVRLSGPGVVLRWMETGHEKRNFSLLGMRTVLAATQAAHSASPKGNGAQKKTRTMGWAGTYKQGGFF